MYKINKAQPHVELSTKLDKSIRFIGLPFSTVDVLVCVTYWGSCFILNSFLTQGAHTA